MKAYKCMNCGNVEIGELIKSKCACCGRDIWREFNIKEQEEQNVSELKVVSVWVKDENLNMVSSLFQNLTRMARKSSSIMEGYFTENELEFLQEHEFAIDTVVQLHSQRGEEELYSASGNHNVHITNENIMGETLPNPVAEMESETFKLKARIHELEMEKHLSQEIAKTSEEFEKQFNDLENHYMTIIDGLKQENRVYANFFRLLDVLLERYPREETNTDWGHGR